MLGDLAVGRVAVEGGGKGAVGVRDRPGGVAALSSDRIESPNSIEDRAPDPQDRIRLERGTAFGSIGIARSKQAQHARLHRIVVVEHADDPRAQPIDHVAHEVAVSVEDEVALLDGGARCGRHVQAAAG